MPTKELQTAVRVDQTSTQSLYGNLRNYESKHGERILVVLLDEPDRAHQHDDDVEAKDHGEQLRLESAEAERSLDDDVGERTETAGGKRGGQLDASVAPGLRICEGIPDLFLFKFLVLDTGLVVSNTLDHQLLVLLGEALGSHGRIRHVNQHDGPEEDGDDAVGKEEPLPGLERAGLDQAEAVGEQAADNLLSTVHHVPVGDSGSLLLALVPHGGQHDETWLADGFEEA